MHSYAQKFSILASFDRFDIKSFQICKNLFTKMSRTPLINSTSLTTLATFKPVIGGKISPKSEDITDA